MMKRISTFVLKRPLQHTIMSICIAKSALKIEIQGLKRGGVRDHVRAQGSGFRFAHTR